MQTIIYKINNKVLLCSTGNCIQYPVINHNGKVICVSVCVCVYIYIYIYMTESLCYTAEIKHNMVNQLYFNKIKKKSLAT